MKSIGTTLIVLSVVAVIGILLVAFLPRELFAGGFTQTIPTPRPARNSDLTPFSSEVVDPTVDSLTLLYALPVILLLACFVQVLGWGLLIVGMLQDQQPITPKRIGL